MTESRETTGWDAIRHAVIPPVAPIAPAPKVAPVQTATVSLPGDAAPSGPAVATGGMAPASVGLHGASDTVVKAEISAKAEEFQGLAAANKHLNKGQPVTDTTGQAPAITATVTVTRRNRNGQAQTETRTVGWLSQYEQLPASPKGNRFAGQAHSNDRTYGRNVNEVVGIADSILQELQFLQGTKGLDGSSYRSLADAVAVAKASPNNRQAMLSLYGEMITFVQIVRQSGTSTRDYPQFLQDNYDAFANSAAEAGGVDALVTTILRDLKVADVASLQRDKLGMTGAAVTGRFDAQTYFATQLYVMEQMARNLSRRDGLGMAVMQQSVKDAKATVDRMVDLRTNFADRVRQNHVSAATLSFLTSQGYKLENGALKKADGAAIADSQLGALSAQWLEEATYMAQQSHKDVQDAMALHGTYLTKNQRKQVEGWVNAYELFYKDTMTRGSAPTGRSSLVAPTGYQTSGTGELGQPNGPPPEQPDATDAMAVATLERVAVNEERRPDLDPGKVDDPAEVGARLERSAKVAQEMSQFYVRLKDGLDVVSLSGDELRTVTTLQRYGYIRQEGTTVYLTATDDQLRDFGKMAETFASPESPAAAAILNTVISGFVQVHRLAALKEDILGIPMLSSGIGDFLSPGSDALAGEPRADVPAADPQITGDDTQPTDHPYQPDDDHDHTPEPRQVRTDMPSSPAAAPARVSLLTDWPDEVHDQREERERRAERQRQETIDADHAYAEAVQAKGAKLVQERREDILSTGTRVVRGADGKAVGVVTTGDGQVIGVSPAVDPGKATE
jgi:hypothetical protein